MFDWARRSSVAFECVALFCQIHVFELCSFFVFSFRTVNKQKQPTHKIPNIPNCVHRSDAFSPFGLALVFSLCCQHQMTVTPQSGIQKLSSSFMSMQIFLSRLSALFAPHLHRNSDLLLSLNWQWLSLFSIFFSDPFFHFVSFLHPLIVF